jgi:hypothetical protein
MLALVLRERFVKLLQPGSVAYQQAKLGFLRTSRWGCDISPAGVAGSNPGDPGVKLLPVSSINGTRVAPQGRTRVFVVGGPSRARVGEGAGGGNTPSRWGFGGLPPKKFSKLFTLKCVFKLISQLILNTERSYSGLLIFGYIRGCLRLLLNLLKFVVFEAPETLVQAISCLQLVIIGLRLMA